VQPTRILLLRHGEVAHTWGGRIYGAVDVPLSPRGELQGLNIAVLLAAEHLSAVISSGLSRTESMAAAVRSRQGLERFDDTELRELERGSWVGLRPDEVDTRWHRAWSAWCAEPHVRRAPGGESLADLERRVRPRLDHWASRFPGQSIAVVTHVWVIRVLVCHVMGLSLSQAPKLEIGTADLVILRWLQAPALGTLEAFCPVRAPTVRAVP